MANLSLFLQHSTAGLHIAFCCGDLTSLQRVEASLSKPRDCVPQFLPVTSSSEHILKSYRLNNIPVLITIQIQGFTAKLHDFETFQCMTSTDLGSDMRSLYLYVQETRTNGPQDVSCNYNWKERKRKETTQPYKWRQRAEKVRDRDAKFCLEKV